MARMARVAQEQMSREDPGIFQEENKEWPKPLKKKGTEIYDAGEGEEGG